MFIAVLFIEKGKIEGIYVSINREMTLKKDDASVPRSMTQSLIKKNEVAVYAPT